MPDPDHDLFDRPIDPATAAVPPLAADPTPALRLPAWCDLADDELAARLRARLEPLGRLPELDELVRYRDNLGYAAKIDRLLS